MRLLEEIGECPKCGCSLMLYKTNNHKRFIKCEEPQCSLSYPIPHRGKISPLGVRCPKDQIPLLIIQNAQNSRFRSPTYFWAQGPCFDCRNYEKCITIKELEEEFKEYEEYGFKKN